MDKKTIIGLVIIGAIIFGFSWYQSNQSKKYAETKRIADSVARAEGRLVELPSEEQMAQDRQNLETTTVSSNTGGSVVADSIKQARLGEALFNAAVGEEKLYTLENEVIKMTLSNKGGKVVGVELKDYKTYGGDPLQLYAEGTAKFNMTFFIRNQYADSRIISDDYYFECQDVESAGGEKKLSMRLRVDNDAYVEYIYTLRSGEYMVDFDVDFVNMKKLISNQMSFINMAWSSTAIQNEKGFENENKYSSVVYKHPGDSSVDNLGMSKGSKSETVKNSLHWIAFKQQFFSSVIISENNFMSSEVGFDTFNPEAKNLKHFFAEANVPFNREQTKYSFKFYYGPNKYSILKGYDIGMERLIDLGWPVVRHVNKYIIIPVFNWLVKYLNSFGLIILLLTIFTKILILPLTYRSHLSMGKMRLLKPELDAINAKYPKKEDAMKKQQEVMALYKRAGVSPMGGCLPMLIQFPILVALFYFFPTSIELRGESFLWAEDLSTYDSILNLPFSLPIYGSHVSLFALLMAAMLFISTKLNPQTGTGTQMAGMKSFMYIMPIMLLVMFNNYASGLCYYYFLSTALTMVQTWGFKFVVNDDKLHARMQANAANKSNGKKKGKSKWQQRYEEMMKAQQQQQQKKK